MKRVILEKYTTSSEMVHYCIRCKTHLIHRVLELDGAKPKRILCITCQTRHDFRAKPLGGRQKLLEKAATAKVTLEAKLRNRLHKSMRTPKNYSMDGTFQVDDVVRHSAFGLGLATELVLPDKVRIFFDDGLRLMKCGTIQG
jgi:ribosomal protein L44E